MLVLNLANNAKFNAPVGHAFTPLVFCLLPDKGMRTYKQMFLEIKAKCLELGEVFAPDEVVVDFEMAIHTAVRMVWPNAQVSGCRFYLGQAWHRQIQKLGHL